MDDTTLWAIALGVGALGLVLVVVAGVAAVSSSARARRSRETPSAPEPQPHAVPPDVVQSAGGGGWLWLKAGVFAFIHAGAVSFVLGGLTFFEDIAKANEEIRTTGTVTFPKRLLPRTLTGPEASLPLSGPSDDLLASRDRAARTGGAGQGDLDRAASHNPESTDWEVVDAAAEDAAAGDGAAEGTADVSHPS